jgi:hypothetical protein
MAKIERSNNLETFWDGSGLGKEAHVEFALALFNSEPLQKRRISLVSIILKIGLPPVFDASGLKQQW